MRMTPWKLVSLRLYLLTLGRSAWGSRLLRQRLLQALVRDKAVKYVPSSRVFEPKELDVRV